MPDVCFLHRAVHPGAAVLPGTVVKEPIVVIQRRASPHWEKGSPLRPVSDPLAWAGDDRILLDDVSRCGLRRKVIARKGGMPNQMDWVLQVYQIAGDAKVCWWMYERDEFVFLWIVWKEGKYE